jgi:hypothetical protein
MEKGEGTQLALTGMLLFLAGKKRSDGKLSTSCNFNKANIHQSQSANFTAN